MRCRTSAPMSLSTPLTRYAAIFSAHCVVSPVTSAIRLHHDLKLKRIRKPRLGSQRSYRRSALKYEARHLAQKNRSSNKTRGAAQLKQTAHPFPYVIRRRWNTGTFAKSKMNANTAAATRIPPTTNIGRGAIAIPRVASVEAINTSTTEDPTSNRLGRQDPM